MSQFGEFLEVVYGSASQFVTIRAAIRQWRNRGLAENADGGGKLAIGRRKAAGQALDQPPEIEKAMLSVWINLPNRYRIEKTEESGGRSEKSILIGNGEQRWNINHDGHVETSKAAEGQDTDIARHFEHSSLREYFVSLALGPLGLVQTAGRSCIRLRAVPRPGARLWPHWLPHGADEYEFHADLERGVLLYIAGRFRGEIFEANEVDQVVFDEPLDDSLFSYTPTLGQQVQPADPIFEPLTLRAAIARMPFTVLIPSRLPVSQNGELHVMYHPPRGRSARAHLNLMYQGEHSLWIDESDTADADLEKMEWERIDHEGQLMALSDPNVDAGMRILSLVQQGTHVAIMSSMGREELIDLAASLTAAP